MELNEHIVNLKESATLEINQRVRKERKEGREVFHFGFGQSPFPVPKVMVKALQENAYHKDYLTTLGLPELREKIVEYFKNKFGYKFHIDQILIGPGSKELIFQALFCLEGPVLVPAPSWVSYGPQVEARGKKVIHIQCDEENSYKLTAEKLHETCKHMKSKQKIIIINSPNNPTGAVYYDEEIEAISKVAREHNVIIISDEIYAEVDFTNSKKKGFFHYYPEGTIVTTGLSKAQGAGGWRLGVLCTSKELSPLIDSLCTLVSETFSAVSAPIQYAAIKAYCDDPEMEEYLKTTSLVHKACSEYLRGRLLDMGATVPTGEGAFYLFPSFNNFKERLEEKYKIRTSREFVDKLYEQTGVAFLPGTDFYRAPDDLTCRLATVDYDGELVLSKARSEEVNEEFINKYCQNLVKGMDLLKQFL